ncbi:MAG: DoxX family protein [Paralcaligenes sp.]
MSNGNCQMWTSYAQAVLRVVSAYMIMLHGAAKLLHVPHIAGFDNLQIFSLIGLAGVIELVFGGLLLIGLFTRVAAFIMSGEMAVAYFMAHASRGNPLFPLMNGGEPAVLYCFVFLFLAVAGAGACSIDRWRGAKC